MSIILGVDPGSRKTGYGLIHQQGNRLDFLACGIIRIDHLDFPDRLRTIFTSLQRIIEQHQPETMVVEQVFMAKNASAALKLGQARGAIITSGAVAELAIEEYSARQIKQAVVGIGSAQKAQVQMMVREILQLSQTPQEDAADALAAAVCHANTQQALIRKSSSLRQIRLTTKGKAK